MNDNDAKPSLASNDVATRVAAAMQKLDAVNDRESWAIHHAKSTLEDFHSYTLTADAVEEKTRREKLDSDLPLQSWIRAKRRARPLRSAARHMRKAAKALNGTTAAYEKHSPEKAKQDRDNKILSKDGKRRNFQRLAQNSSAHAIKSIEGNEGKSNPVDSSVPSLRDFVNKKGA